MLLRRMAWLCVVLVIVVTSLSAFIRLTRAGLGCADWPACYGRVVSQQQPHAGAVAADSAPVVAARIAHRIFASGALLLIAVIAMTSLAARPRRWREGALSIALLALALFLAVLGRWSAGTLLPAVTLANLLAGFMMVALAVSLALDAAKVRGERAPPRWRAWALAVVVAVAAQVALGGLLSAAHAGLSCPGLGACDVTGASWRAALDPWREPLLDASGSAGPAGALLQQLHRTGALLVAALLVPLALAMLRGRQRRAGALLLVLLAVQLALGVALVSGALLLPVALAHNLVAALLLATAFACATVPPVCAASRAAPDTA
jgi:cytochrome c oxidase assembly protein subunit 15